MLRSGEELNVFAEGTPVFFPYFKRYSAVTSLGREGTPVIFHGHFGNRGRQEMTGTLAPRDSKELRQAVEWALNEGVTLDVRGGGSKLSLGKPMTCDQVLDLSGLTGVVDYAPEELVVTLRAGTPMREVEALLAQRNQMLAFEPPDLGPLLGRARG